MKITQDREKCIGCGACAAICPDFWEMSDDGKAKLRGSSKNADGIYELSVEGEAMCNEDAASGCPVNIIKIEK